MDEHVVAGLERARLKGWFELIIKGKPPFFVDEETIFRHALKVGDALSESRVIEIGEEADLAWLKNKGVQILSRRMISERDLRRKLTAERRPQRLRDQAVSQLKEYGFIDDAKFAATFIRSQLSRGPGSRRYLKKKLMGKGITAEIAEQALDTELEGFDEVPAVRELAAKKYKTVKHLPPLKAKSRVINFLRGRGFSWDVIRTVVADLIPGDSNTSSYE